MESVKENEPLKYEPLGVPRMLVVFTTLVVAAWYMWWRLGTFNPDAKAFSYLLYAGEWFGIITLLLHYFMVRRLSIREAPLPEAGHTVDVFIPTYNEPVDIVRRTLVTAIGMEYPHTTYLLDDGNREEMRKLAEELGCKYLARETNENAKAGNLNYGIKHSSGEFIAIFDADHAPKKTFLMRTLGYFKDPSVAFVQTPQDFYNLDSFQHRVVRKSGQVWSEQSLFFRVIQRGKDYWNAAFFCGSCAILRRSALEAVGGIATGTITEDIHTSIRLHKYGYKSVYHAESLAFGIAPAHIEPFLKQRIRWGQGAMQVWRREGVIFNRHLTLAQKLNYIASMAIYFDGWQKFLYYLTPIVVLLTGMMPLVTTMEDFLLHFIPFFVMSVWCFEELGRGYSEMLYVEQYNMARFAAFCYSTLGLFMGDLKFKVTNKKMPADRAALNLYLMPQYAVLVLNITAIPIGLILYSQTGHLSFYSLLANMVWCSLNLTLASMVLAFSIRRGRFKRSNYRFSIPLVARLKTTKGKEIFASIDDLSCAGLFLMIPRELMLRKNDTVTGTIFLPDGPLSFDAVVKALHNTGDSVSLDGIGCEFLWKDETARQRMERFLYGSDLEWQLHKFSEINWTLLGANSDRDTNVIPLPSWGRGKSSRLAPMVLNPDDAGAAAVNAGIIALDARTKRGSMLVFKPLPEEGSELVDAMLLTSKGWQTMRTRVANQNKPERGMGNMFLYELEGLSA